MDAIPNAVGKFILFLIVWSAAQGAPQVSSTVFASQAACEAAGKALVADLSGLAESRYLCVPEGN